MTRLETIFKRIRFRLEHAGLQSAAWLIRRFPYDAIEPLANMLGEMVYHLDARGRGVALENLRAAFGNRYNGDEREMIARGSYQNFARTMFSLFWSPNLTLENYQEWIRVTGRDNHPIHTSPELPGVYFLGHISNFEWLSWASAPAISAGLVITQKLKNPSLGPIFDQLRGGSGHTIIPRERAVVRMLKFLKSGGKVGAAIDTSIDPKLGALPIRCFGLWTPVSPLAPMLAMRAQAALVPSIILPEDNGKFVIDYRRPIEISDDATAQEIAQACWDVLEAEIAARPELWLWSYKQWRFRPADDESGRYPRYSNSSKRFDRLLKEHGIESAQL